MRNLIVLFLSATFLLSPQNRAARSGSGSQPPLARLTPPDTSTVDRDYVRENYTKFEYRIAMRDGVKLFTSVYVPKDVFTDSRTYPIMMLRTGYGVPPYGLEDYRANLGPSELFAREKFIFVYQDVRGRFLS
jgi:predicted acyl esterase